MKCEMPKTDANGISVVIPLYNKAATVARALDSVLAQWGVLFEVIVVDDESSDGSRQIVESYGDRVRLIPQRNAGPSAARNRGVQEARYAWATFLDADDAFSPDCLATHWQGIAQSPEAGLSLVSFQFVSQDGSRKEELLGRRLRATVDQQLRARIQGFHAGLVINVHIGTVCLRRDLFFSTGQFDTELISWEITDFLMRLMKQAGNLIVTDKVGLTVYDTPNSQSTKTHRKAPYLARVAGKMLAELESVPPCEQKPLLAQLKSFLHALWDVGALHDLHILACTARPSFVQHEMDDRFLRIAASPTPVLKTCHVLRRLKQRVLA